MVYLFYYTLAVSNETFSDHDPSRTSKFNEQNFILGNILIASKLSMVGGQSRAWSVVKVKVNYVTYIHVPYVLWRIMKIYSCLIRSINNHRHERVKVQNYKELRIMSQFVISAALMVNNYQSTQMVTQVCIHQKGSNTRHEKVKVQNKKDFKIIWVNLSLVH